MSERRGAARVAVAVEERPGGAMLLRNRLSLPGTDTTIPARLAHWAATAPERVFLTEPAAASGDQHARRRIAYGEAEARRRWLAARLPALPVSAARPLMILAANGIDHALLMLAATSIGVPVAIVSPAYAAARAEPWGKFAVVVERLDPGLIVADDVAGARYALAATGREDIRVEPIADPAWLEAVAPVDPARVDAAEAAVGPDTAAKLLLTSGSTGTPKAVVNTQRMMVSNMAGLSQVWPFLADRPPVLVDWLPWNHTFGGNCCFNIALFFGGTLHVDAGKPAPGMIGPTVAAIGSLAPTVYFNVPVGYEMLLPALEADHDLAQRFLGGLDCLFNAAAALPPSTRARLEALAQAVLGRPVPIFGGWGSTETAPFSTVLYFPTDHASNLGAPLPGTEILMVPEAERFELRVRGPNVTPGYWRDDAATAAAFDDEGFYRIGDAGRLAEAGDADGGILFDGRISENFKLNSGTWVNVGAVRIAVVSALDTLVSDAVIAGEGCDELGVLLFANEERCRAVAPAGEGAAARHPLVRDRVAALLRAHNADQMGSSTRIARFLILEEPPSANDGEITDKGYLNQRLLLERRRAAVERLYGDEGVF